MQLPSVRKALRLGMGVDENKLIAFTHDLGMVGGDNGFIDDNVVTRVTPNIDNLLIERISVAFIMNVRTNF